MDSHVKRCIQTHLRMSKKFHIGITVIVNTSHSLRNSQISVLRHNFVCKNVHAEKVFKLNRLDVHHSR